MRLENTLYRILSKDGNNYDLELLPDCTIYKAHFPGMPVTPGVCIIQMVKEIAEDSSGLSLDIKKVRNVKFLSILTPEAKPRVALEKLSPVAEQEGTVMIQARIASNQEVFAAVSLICVERNK